jgi:hypothetical protein
VSSGVVHGRLAAGTVNTYDLNHSTSMPEHGVERQNVFGFSNEGPNHMVDRIDALAEWIIRRELLLHH